MSMSLKPSKAEAQRFLDMLDPGGMFVFQIIDDDKDRKRGHLSKFIHGALDTHFDTLVHYNEQGAGIFVVINQTDFKGRKASNVLKVRACFVDLDGARIGTRAQSPTRADHSGRKLKGAVARLFSLLGYAP